MMRWCLDLKRHNVAAREQNRPRTILDAQTLQQISSQDWGQNFKERSYNVDTP
jgi:hypothetical protein